MSRTMSTVRRSGPRSVTSNGVGLVVAREATRVDRVLVDAHVQPVPAGLEALEHPGPGPSPRFTPQLTQRLAVAWKHVKSGGAAVSIGCPSKRRSSGMTPPSAPGARERTSRGDGQPGPLHRRAPPPHPALSPEGRGTSGRRLVGGRPVDEAAPGLGAVSGHVVHHLGGAVHRGGRADPAAHLAGAGAHGVRVEGERDAPSPPGRCARAARGSTGPAAGRSSPRCTAGSGRGRPRRKIAIRSGRSRRHVGDGPRPGARSGPRSAARVVLVHETRRSAGSRAPGPPRARGSRPCARRRAWDCRADRTVPMLAMSKPRLTSPRCRCRWRARDAA